jgi:hypothetical protein
MLRLPRRLLDVQTAQRYYVDECAEVWAKDEHVIVELRSEQEPTYDDEDGEDWMPALLPLRAEIAAGDRRALYLGWLAGVWRGMVDDDEVEPPPPPGLGQLSASLQALSDFLRLDDDLLAVAAERSKRPAPMQPSRQALERWIGGLAEAEKNRLLLRLMDEGDPHLRAKLLQRYQTETKTPDLERADDAGGRTVGQLLASAQHRTERRKRAEAERAAQERARIERERAAARARYLDQVAGREAEAWQRVDASIATKRPSEYDAAVQLLVDLRDLHARSDRAAQFEPRLNHLREQHARKPSLLQRMDQAGLGS